MAHDGRADARGSARRPPSRSAARPCFAALDLGTNNCRLLIAEPEGAGFRVIDGFSQIVRLGEGLGASGRLSDTAMARTYKALAACAERIEWRRPVSVGCVATQALRVAANGAAFLERVRQDFGLEFEVITTEEEARLSVLGCAGLIDPDSDVALIVDIGGGSTELSWVESRAVRNSVMQGRLDPPLIAWRSTPVGVVALADAHPETDDVDRWYESLVVRVVEALGAPEAAEQVRPAFEGGRAHIVGTSGTVTSLTGVHLGLARYRRADVDGRWISVEECRAAVAKLRGMTRAERAQNPCIGRDRADLVVPGGAILEAVFRRWPVERVRVADRGLREGVLMHLIAARQRQSQ